MFGKLFLVVAAMAQLSLAQPEVPGTLVDSPYSPSDLSIVLTTTCNAGYYSFCDSCSSYMVCVAGTSSGRVQCSGDMPFCSNNTCSATQNFDNCPPTAFAECSSEGFFPDPKACTFYHYCEQAKKPSTVYKCPPNYVYNVDTHLCKQKKVASDCVTINCDPTKFIQSYGTSKTYFAYCTPTEIVMLKCEDNYVLSGSDCVFQCPREGYFKHPVATKYYNCYYSGTKLMFTAETCVAGQEFNETKQICIKTPVSSQ